jgi:hypothetical protein
MKLVPAETERDQERYVCTDCDDPMRDPVARHWAESPLKAPED